MLRRAHSEGALQLWALLSQGEARSAHELKAALSAYSANGVRPLAEGHSADASQVARAPLSLDGKQAANELRSAWRRHCPDEAP